MVCWVFGGAAVEWGLIQAFTHPSHYVLRLLETLNPNIGFAKLGYGIGVLTIRGSYYLGVYPLIPAVLNRD